MQGLQSEERRRFSWRVPKNERRYPLGLWKLLMRAERYTLAMQAYGWSVFCRVLDKLRGRGWARRVILTSRC